MTCDEISTRVRSLLQSEFVLELEQTLPQARLQEDLDSIDLVAIAMRLERELDVLAKENPLRSPRTVRDLVEFVFALKLSEPAPGRPE